MVYKRIKYTIGKSGINFLIAGYHAFTEEIQIFEKQIKDFPNRESSIKAKKYVKQLTNITVELKGFIEKVEQKLKF